MTQQHVEIILLRQLFTTLDIPVFIVSPDGALLFYNRPAEPILGKKFIETGIMQHEEWSMIFKPMNVRGKIIPPEKLPLSIAINKKRQARGKIFITSLDHVTRQIEIYSFPIINNAEEFLGAVALFWKIK